MGCRYENALVWISINNSKKEYETGERRFNHILKHCIQLCLHWRFKSATAFAPQGLQNIPLSCSMKSQLCLKTERSLKLEY